MFLVAVPTPNNWRSGDAAPYLTRTCQKDPSEKDQRSQTQAQAGSESICYAPCAGKRRAGSWQEAESADCVTVEPSLFQGTRAGQDLAGRALPSQWSAGDRGGAVLGRDRRGKFRMAGLPNSSQTDGPFQSVTASKIPDLIRLGQPGYPAYLSPELYNRDAPWWSQRVPCEGDAGPRVPGHPQALCQVDHYRPQEDPRKVPSEGEETMKEDATKRWRIAVKSTHE